MEKDKLWLSSKMEVKNSDAKFESDDTVKLKDYFVFSGPLFRDNVSRRVPPFSKIIFCFEVWEVFPVCFGMD